IPRCVGRWRARDSAKREDRPSRREPPVFVDLYDGNALYGSALVDELEIGHGQPLDLLQHLAQKFKSIVYSVGIDSLNHLSNELLACGKNQLLPSAAEQHVHTLGVFEEPKRARSHHNIVAREAGDYDIRFTSLEAVTCKEELSVVARAGKAEQSLVFVHLSLEQMLEPIDLR